ncbi:carboxypeptidase-like regulatory domain-containing protein [Solitalea sp. MAHUQ-68]|uniref:Carboxypeptidase-like regulatory domain-containing protein n=1 Tax=Solitalea agri TaxID=2953739 RepID=A0A9X2JDG1_9SPHI|nr:carboxypeptidase-like regulatory domain-containing protein [Solitalea agri]MCO4294113.1 carboxypeptidase-like regulatory domain-containing protein [Solitalea agri]
MKSLLCFLAVLLVYGCGKSEDSNGGVLNSNLSASVKLFDELGNPQTPPDGVVMTLNNVHPKRSGTSDRSGNCQILSVSPGKYDIFFSKSGYDTFRLYQFEYKQRQNTIDDIKLSQFSTTLVSNLKVTFNSSSQKYAIEGVIAPITADDRWIRLFLGDNNVSSLDYTYSPSVPVIVNNGAFKIEVSKSDVLLWDVVENGKFYVIAYGAPAVSTHFRSPSTKKEVYLALSSTGSNIAEGILE